MLVHLRFMSGKTYEDRFKPTATVKDVKARAAEAFWPRFKLPAIEILREVEILPNDAVLKDASTEARFVFGVVVKGEKRCTWCHEPALQKCSTCKSVRYCTRECQVAHWPVHKLQCNVRGDVSGDESDGSD